jgi:quinol monooxygenase YgiN
MIIVQGVFRIAPEDREQFLTESLDLQRISRSEPGCVEYVFAADPVEPDRVILSERWQSRADLDAHLEALTARRKDPANSGVRRIAPISRDVSFFDAGEIDMSSP